MKTAAEVCWWIGGVSLPTGVGLLFVDDPNWIGRLVAVEWVGVVLTLVGLLALMTGLWLKPGSDRAPLASPISQSSATGGHGTQAIATTTINHNYGSVVINNQSLAQPGGQGSNEGP